MNYQQYCNSCKNYDFDIKKGILCGLTGLKPSFENECSNFVLDPIRRKKVNNGIQKLELSKSRNKGSIIDREFKKCALGGLIVGLLISSFVSFFVIPIKNIESIFLNTLGIYIIYNIFSWLLYAFLSYSRRMLEVKHESFVIATLIVTGGGWWLGHALAFINVTITKQMYDALFKK